MYFLVSAFFAGLWPDHYTARLPRNTDEAAVCVAPDLDAGQRGKGESTGANVLPSLGAVVPLPLVAPTVWPLDLDAFPPAAGTLGASDGHPRRHDRPPIDSRAA